MFFSLTIPAEVDALEQITPLIEKAAMNAPDRLPTQLALAVHELCVNIIDHGYAGTPGEIRIEISSDDYSLSVHIQDEGPNLYSQVEVIVPEPLDLPEDGWEIVILHRVMDEVRYNRIDSINDWYLLKLW